MKKLTSRQRRILDFIRNYIRDKRYSPSFREIGTEFGIHLQCVFGHLKALRKKGYLSYKPFCPRTIRLPKCFLLQVTESVEICTEIPTIQVGDVLTIRETTVVEVGDIVIVSQDPIVVKPFEKGDSDVFGKVIGLSRAVA